MSTQGAQHAGRAEEPQEHSSQPNINALFSSSQVTKREIVGHPLSMFDAPVVLHLPGFGTSWRLRVRKDAVKMSTGRRVRTAVGSGSAV
jgi:hypothetical protein